MVVIQIASGQIQGRKNVLTQEKYYYSFQNISYAQPPTGNLRFRAPRPILPWKGIRDCTKEGNESVSRNIFSKQIVGSEDCLNLNVYTREISKNSNQHLRPVMFWIHGGIFVTGSNKTELYGPEFLMNEDIVLVTINYRLGILGFLSLDDPSLEIPGNAAFKDMVLALKWVHKNIIHFNGNPNNVTVCGQSAGAVAAHLLMLSPMTKGLIHRVILQSSCALNSWVTGKRSARAIASKLGFESSDDKQIYSFLQETPAEQLVKVQILLDSEDFLQQDLRFFGLVFERPSNEEAFMTEHPRDIILSGNYHHVPLIMGYNEREGISFDDAIPFKTRKAFFEDMELSVPISLNVKRGSMLSKDIAQRIEKFYFGEVEPRNRNDHLYQYHNLATDTTFFRDVYFSICLHLKTSRKPIYFYKLNLDTELNIFKRLQNNTFPGVCHGDDIGYIFKTMFTPDILPESEVDKAQRRITRLWANFARFGIPTPENDIELLSNIKWEPVKLDSIRYLEMGTTFRMINVKEQERLDFWSRVFKLNQIFSKL